jgi:hypothetical protein
MTYDLTFFLGFYKKSSVFTPQMALAVDPPNSLQSRETEKYGYGSRGARNQE